LLRYTKDEFMMNSASTIGVEFATRNIELASGAVGSTVVKA